MGVSWLHVVLSRIERNSQSVTSEVTEATGGRLDLAIESFTRAICNPVPEVV